MKLAQRNESSFDSEEDIRVICTYRRLSVQASTLFVRICHCNSLSMIGVPVFSRTLKAVLRLELPLTILLLATPVH